jgi:hypothetical protein
VVLSIRNAGGDSTKGEEYTFPLPGLGFAGRYSGGLQQTHDVVIHKTMWTSLDLLRESLASKAARGRVG